ncbi:MAG: hypothetical protein AB7I13_20380, partial [Vicinamibacterales bacterium]
MSVVRTPGSVGRLVVLGIAAWAATMMMSVGPEAQAADPIRYTDKGELLKPADFREWVFLSAGLGMNYNPQGAGAANPS